MPRTSRVVVAIGCLSILVLARASQAQEPQQDFASWLAERIRNAVVLALEKSPGTTQTEAPSAASSSTSIVDQASFSDLIGVALNLAQLSPSSSDNEANSVAVTLSAYTIYAALKGEDPLDPEFYRRHRDYRRVALILGREAPADQQPQNGEGSEGEAESGGSEGPARPVTLVGAKVLVVNRRDPGHAANAATLQEIERQLGRASSAFARISKRVETYLFVNMAPALGFDGDVFDFVGDYLSDDPTLTRQVFDLVGPEELQAIDGFIESELAAFIELDEGLSAAIETIRRAPQMSVTVLGTVREDGPEDYTVEGVLEKGLGDSSNFTFNFGYQHSGSETEGEEVHEGQAGAKLRLDLTPGLRLDNRGTVALDFAGDASWMDARKPRYRGQLKLTIPVYPGIELPVAFTFANRTVVVEDKDIRGQLGFAFDLSRLLEAARSR